MKPRFLLSFASVLILSCAKPMGEPTPRADAAISLVEEFQLALKNNKEIVFIDSSNRGASKDGSIMNLHFFENSELTAYTVGNGFSNYQGTSAFHGSNGVAIHIVGQNWPELILSKEGDRFLLSRKDGLRSLTKHIIFTDKDGTRTLINDGDIYPEAESSIFPFKQKMTDDDQ